MGDLFSVLGKGIVGIVEDIFATQRATAAAKIELEKVKVESTARIAEARVQAAINLAANAQAHEFDWEKIMAQNSDRSWKDEYVLILFSIPLVMAFIPQLQPYVSQGFEALEIAPDWYLQIVLAGAAVSYGIRKLVDIPFLRKRK